MREPYLGSHQVWTPASFHGATHGGGRDGYQGESVSLLCKIERKKLKKSPQKIFYKIVLRETSSDRCEGISDPSMWNFAEGNIIYQKCFYLVKFFIRGKSCRSANKLSKSQIRKLADLNNLLDMRSGPSANVTLCGFLWFANIIFRKYMLFVLTNIACNALIRLWYIKIVYKDF
jgi:hypothetical protein